MNTSIYLRIHTTTRFISAHLQPSLLIYMMDSIGINAANAFKCDVCVCEWIRNSLLPTNLDIRFAAFRNVFPFNF